MEKAKIVFNDGTQIKPEINGSTFILSKKPDFPADLTDIEITTKDGITTVPHGMIIECAPAPGDTRYWFAIADIPVSEIERDRMDAQVMYTALMTDTLMEEEV